MSDERRLRVLLLFGGRSAEHDVSRMTAVAVARALDPQRYEVVPVGITTEGEWLLASEAERLLDAGAVALPDAFEVAGHAVAVPSDPARPELVPVNADVEVRGIDVVLPLLHGPYGEDGTVQGLMELAGLPYVGAGVLASAVGMDKIAMKRMFAAANLPYVRYVGHRDRHDVADLLDRVERELGFPCFAKPANMGSSVGVTKAKNRGELEDAVEVAASYDEWVVVEEAITGRELEVAVLGDDPPRASVPGEVIPSAEFYDYADKYEHDTAELVIPAVLDDQVTAEVRSLALRAFEACRCEAMARVDFFFEEGGRGMIVNELNTIPGFTPHSMYPKLWECSGVSYSDLLDRLVELALVRHERRRARAGRQR